MYYNISELMDNLGEKVEELGISPAFKENPAYDTALGSIRRCFMKYIVNYQSKKKRHNLV